MTSDCERAFIFAGIDLIWLRTVPSLVPRSAAMGRASLPSTKARTTRCSAAVSPNTSSKVWPKAGCQWYCVVTISAKGELLAEVSESFRIWNRV